MKLQNLVFLFLLLFWASCSNKQEFIASKNNDATTISNPQEYSSKLCADSTLIKPPVDFLFLWDNTSGQTFLTSQVKQALWNTINLVSSRFDFRIMIAPLVKQTPTDLTGISLIAPNPTGITSPLQRVTYDKAIEALINMPQESSLGSFENGANRAVALLKLGAEQGIFRQKAHTIVALMSNGDDTTWVNDATQGSDDRDKFTASTTMELLKIKNTTLEALTFRFMSLVPHKPDILCPGIGKKFEANTVYKELSRRIYSSQNLTDQSGRTTPDSYDICEMDFVHIFDGINNAISDVVLKHQYDYWPVAQANSTDIDPSQITVVKNTGVQIPESSVDGFQWAACESYPRNTRYAPSAGEPYTGCLIKLNGTAKVTYPECLIVKTKAPVECFGYLQLSSKPMLSSVKVYINGNLIPHSSTNGWSDAGPSSNLDVKVACPNSSFIVRPLFKSGHFLKLNGNAIYKNGDTTRVIYDPKGY